MATPAQWVAGARPRTLPAAVAPVLVGTGAAAALDGFRLGAGAARAGRRARAAGRGQLRQRLLRRHAAAPTPTGSGRCGWSARAPPPRARCCVAAGAGLRRRGASPGWRWRRCRAGGWSPSARSASRPPGPTPAGPIPYGYRGARRGLRLRVLRPGRRRRDDVRADRARCPGWRSPSRCPIGLLIVAILVVNNLRDIDGDARRRQAHARGAARRPGDPAAVRRAVRRRLRRRSPPSASPGRGRCWGCSPPRWPSRRRARCSPAGAGRR